METGIKHLLPRWKRHAFVERGFRRMGAYFFHRKPVLFNVHGFPVKPSEACRKVFRAWLTHPSEFLACVVFILFILLSIAAWRLARPGALESLQFSVLYGAGWFLWMAYVVYFLPETSRVLQFLRGFGPWLAVMLSYNWVRYLIPAVHPGRYDQALRWMEISLWGQKAALWTQALFGHPYWTDFFCLLYLGLFCWMFGFLFHYAFTRNPLYQRFMLGLMLIYMGGFAGYLFFPAAGPRYAFPQEWVWLNGGTLFHMTNWIVSHMGAKLDVFPSLHAALSTYLLFWQAEYQKIGVVWGLPLALGIWLSTVYLGFHYFPDLMGGAVLGGATFFLAPRLESSFNRLKEMTEDI